MKNKGRYLIFLGLLLIAAALCLTGYNLYDGQRAEWSAKQAMNELEEHIHAGAADETPDYVLSPYMEMPVETIDGIDYIGVLEIPSLELELPVISQWNYPYLKTAPCRYSGSAYLNNMVICAHNYAAHFGKLKNLREGDRVTFIDMDGNMFTYRVVEQEILNPTAVEDMETGEWDLTLFTCTVGGQSRVTIRCNLEKN